MNVTEQFDLSDDKDAKLTIISSIYSAMISIAQELRRSAERLAIWASGLMLVLAGWLVTGKLQLGFQQKIVVSAAMLLFGLVALLIVWALQQRYRGVAQVIRRINELQMAHKTGAYFKDETLFPVEWQYYGAKKWKEPIFRISYLSVSVVTSFCTLIIWL